MNGPIHFVTTDFFQILPDEEKETNPGRYGKQFATWLLEQFRARGEAVDAVVAEDFGWCVVLHRKPVLFWIACGNRGDSLEEWGAYIVGEPTLMQRLIKRIDVRPEVERLSQLLEEIMRTVPGGTALDVE